MAEVDGSIVQSTIDMFTRFGDVAANDPLTALLLAIGGVLILFSMLFFGALSVGAVFGALARLLPTGGGRPPQAR